MKYIIFILGVIVSLFLCIIKLDTFAICSSLLYAALILSYKNADD